MGLWSQIQSVNHKLTQCICGHEKKNKNFYGDYGIRAAMSPEYVDVWLGLVLIGGFETALLYLAPIAVPILIALVMAIIALLLVVFRLIKKHNTRCSLRWTGIALFGIGGWFSF